jgi:hypothetical protein
MKTKRKAKKRMETVRINGKVLPRYAYRDTPAGTWQEDRKTGKFLWRKLGNKFPES